jgi:hypothetical protein
MKVPHRESGDSWRQRQHLRQSTEGTLVALGTEAGLAELAGLAGLAGL